MPIETFNISLESTLPEQLVDIDEVKVMTIVAFFLFCFDVYSTAMSKFISLAKKYL